MTCNEQRYNLAEIRRLLLSAFTAPELRRFCQDRPAFRPIVDRFGEGHGLDEMVDEVIDYCETRLLWAELLAAVKEENPRQYARFEGDLRAPAGPASPLLEPAAVDAYLEVVRAQCSRLETRPYQQLSDLRGAPPRLSLLDEEGRPAVYVPLRFDVLFRREHLERRLAAYGHQRRDEPMRDARREQEPVAPPLADEVSLQHVNLCEVLEEAFKSGTGHIVFIGAAGCGKSTLLRLVAALLATKDAELAHAELALEPNWVPGTPFPIPVFVALRDFEHACQTDPEAYRRDVDGLLRFVDDHFQRWHPGCVPDGFLSRLVQGGRAWLLLDALDEVADFDRRITVRQVIERLADAFPGNRLLVTARVAAYASANTRLDERFHVATVRDLTREQWAPLVERLYAGMEAAPDVAAERARLLLQRIDDAPLLQEMVKTPLMVWTATLIHYADRELPEQRAELYNAYVDVLLGERLHVEESAEAAQQLQGRWSVDERRLYLSYAAWQAHQGAEAERTGSRSGDAAHRSGDGVVVVDEQDLVRGILAPKMAEWMMLSGDARQIERQARQEAREFLAFMAERSGLLHAHAEGYSFGDHLTVQEFLAANYLADNLRGTGGWAEFLQERAGHSWWREVFLLMAGYLLQYPQQLQGFLMNELGNLPGKDDTHAYGLAWAGAALLEIPEARVRWHGRARDELARRLIGVLWQNPPSTSVAARVEVGDVLGEVGDPRFGGEYLLPEFIPIPGGRFWMGSDEAEVERLVKETGKDWFGREVPRHQVAPSAFALARYPTTNAMFQRFMEAGGYGDGRWWAEAQAAGVWRADGTVKDAWGDMRARPAYWDDARFNGPNQPVVGVTWYEAAAYCRWLTAALDDGGEYRLPSEAEWERAARGPGAGAHRYPWGDEWAAARANTVELGLERTAPVGLFPDGASAEGVLDLAGNVWEWCGDWYGEDTYRDRAKHIASDPRGPASNRYKVLRGGSWADDRDLVRCACRGRGNPDGRHYSVGFRVCVAARQD